MCTGPWTFPGCEAVAVVHTNLSNHEVDPPDLQLMVLPTGISVDGCVHLRKALGISDTPVVSLMPVLLHPKSVGEVLLRSSNPEDPPLIQPNYLTHPQDVETLYHGIELVKKLLRTKPMLELGARLNDKPLPGCESFPFDSKGYWECYIRHLTLTSYHPAGTCRMGPTCDLEAVVNPNLMVHNTHRLFVIDASVMPSLPSANIHAAVMMIAEKGAELVQMHWDLLHGKSTRHSRSWKSIGEEYQGNRMCFS
ncbi:glucose dehydrogenase [FAD, quinone] isoform X2 [Cryptotermes secundus]|uniref:glucose dehydrogenase [FAD, quinone] isoform X2 n=1 Tax=Cryptotermes secundus TaxID=105785 RepID=UPI000CD7D00C|nr:glucose dehydrogenase [FAD, quinone] isoform X2 [Cryptotermes secundus]